MNFRTWLQNKWFEHLDELDSFRIPHPDYDLKKYFEKYKWWLKREYQFQRKQES